MLKKLYVKGAQNIILIGLNTLDVNYALSVQDFSFPKLHIPLFGKLSAEQIAV